MTFTTLIGTSALADLLADARRSATVSAAVAPVVVLDCRFDLMAPAAGRLAYLTAHIPGACHLDLDRDLAAPISPASGRHPLPLPEDLARRLTEVGIDRTTQVVAYDAANGSFAARAWWLLRWLGHRHVAVLDGGLKAWITGGGALESGESAPRDAGHTRAPGSAGPADRAESGADVGAVAVAADVRRALGDPKCLLIDARAPDRYAGVVEPIDAVAGHIPRAVNHPFSHNLGADDKFLEPAELQRRWRERLGGHAARHAIVMCGSGVTACHDLLAMEVAGLSGARLYAGSWSEWIRDPANPVAVGSAPEGS